MKVSHPSSSYFFTICTKATTLSIGVVTIGAAGTAEDIRVIRVDALFMVSTTTLTICVATLQPI